MIGAMRAAEVLSALTLAVMALAGAARADDGAVVRGEARFADCAACHRLEPGVNNVGPSLHGIFSAQGRRGRGFPLFAGDEAQRYRLDS